MTSSCTKARELGVDPYGYKWEKIRKEESYESNNHDK